VDDDVGWVHVTSAKVTGTPACVAVVWVGGVGGAKVISTGRQGGQKGAGNRCPTSIHVMCCMCSPPVTRTKHPVLDMVETGMAGSGRARGVGNVLRRWMNLTLRNNLGGGT
jgi:hypothetical protein